MWFHLMLPDVGLDQTFMLSPTNQILHNMKRCAHGKPKENAWTV